jgi:uncharacterized protein (DUF983 family)
VCGRGAVFETHFRMNRQCPACGVVFWKDPGESLGAMYLDYVVGTVAFVALWIVLAGFTTLSDPIQILILGATAAASVLVFYPITRSAWTVLVYISGGIDSSRQRPPLRAIRGGKRS